MTNTSIAPYSTSIDWNYVLDDIDKEQFNYKTKASDSDSVGWSILAKHHKGDVKVIQNPYIIFDRLYEAGYIAITTDQKVILYRDTPFGTARTYMPLDVGSDGLITDWCKCLIVSDYMSYIGWQPMSLSSDESDRCALHLKNISK